MPETDSGLRAQVRARARHRCEYCLVPERIALIGHEVDHIIAVKHGGIFEFGNLALCCSLCNKHKGSDLTSIDPESGRVEMLYHPRRDAWTGHFQLRGAEIVPLTPTGRVTVRLLRFNRPERLRERELLLRAGLLLQP